MINTCPHEIRKHVQVRPYPDEYPDYEIIEVQVEITTEDIDLHRYQCTQCGEVMFYSGEAKRRYTGE